jgi:hypothetical protein
MTLANRTALFLLSLVGAAFAAGCAGHVDRGDDDAETESVRSALDAADGGMNRLPEAVDEAAYADIAAAEPYADPTPEILPPPPPGRMLTLLMIWGNLPRADTPDPTAWTNWSGAIRVIGGKVRVDRTIAFDKRDHLLERPDASTVAFVSRTLPHVDGLLMHVLQETPDAKVVFDSAATRLVINLADVSPELSGVQPLGDRMNGVAFHAHVDRPGCADGFLFGRYRRLAPGVGKFHLRVTNDRGEPIGKARGIYGHSRKLDQNLFFGKYLSLDGDHRGLLAGTYGEGVFHGDWRYDTGAKGFLHGRYFEGPDRKPGGLAVGRWSEACPLPTDPGTQPVPPDSAAQPQR